MGPDAPAPTSDRRETKMAVSIEFMILEARRQELAEREYCTECGMLECQHADDAEETGECTYHAPIN